MLSENPASIESGMLRRLIPLAVAAALLFGGSVSRADAAELVMVEEIGCVYCAHWDHDIAEIYPKTPEGQAAPLRRIEKDDMPGGLEVLRPVVFTPTFLLVEDGQELARIEGYPGEDFFWGLLGMMLEQHTAYEAGS